MTLNQLFDPKWLRPLTPAAERMMVLFGRWIVAELHERGVQTTGFGRIDPKWLRYRFDYSNEDMRRWLTEERLAYLLARVFFYGKPRNLDDAQLCVTTACCAKVYGLIDGL